MKKNSMEHTFLLNRLHESEWKLKQGPNNGEVTKEVMMVALQNLQNILIRGTYSPDVFNTSLVETNLRILKFF